nr:hypothetical protein [uncultured Methanobrevibacter sp.]
MFEKRIKKFIDLINEKNVTWIKASELRCPEDKYDDEFYEEIKKMDVYGILKVRNFTHTHNSNILLTSKGAFLGKCYIDNYDKIFEDVVSLITSANSSLNNDVEISKRLNVPRIFVDAVFVDLENQNLVKTKTGIGGMYISKFTDRGNDYLF